MGQEGLKRSLPTEVEALAMGFDSQAAYRNETIAKQINPYAFEGPKGAWDGSPPFKFSMAMNFILAIAQMGSAAGSMLFGRMCDLVGAKIPMQICLLMGKVFQVPFPTG